MASKRDRSCGEARRGRDRIRLAREDQVWVAQSAIVTRLGWLTAQASAVWSSAAEYAEQSGYSAGSNREHHRGKDVVTARTGDCAATLTTQSSSSWHNNGESWAGKGWCVKVRPKLPMAKHKPSKWPPRIKWRLSVRKRPSSISSQNNNQHKLISYMLCPSPSGSSPGL